VGCGCSFVLPLTISTLTCALRRRFSGDICYVIILSSLLQEVFMSYFSHKWFAKAATKNNI